MSANCCGDTAKFDGVSKDFKRALWVVIAINGSMFFVEMAAGAFAGSKALQADALDFLGDTVTYAISLFVIGMSLRIRAMAALAKGFSLGAMGLWVFGSTAYQVLILGMPSATIMGAIGFMALAANIISVLLLRRFKDGDAAWPDLIVAALMAGLFLWSATQIVLQARSEWTSTQAGQTALGKHENKNIDECQRRDTKQEAG